MPALADFASGPGALAVICHPVITCQHRDSFAFLDLFTEREPQCDRHISHCMRNVVKPVTDGVTGHTRVGYRGVSSLILPSRPWYLEIERDTDLLATYHGPA